MVELRTGAGDSLYQADIQVVNDGVGPAIIEETRIAVQDAGASERVYGSWAEAAPALRMWGVEIVGRAEFGEGSVFGTGRERSWVTLRLPAAEQPRQARQLFTRLLENVRLTVSYHSIYGGEFRASLPPR